MLTNYLKSFKVQAMGGLKPLSHGVKSVSGKTFEKKFVAIGRVLDNWPAIVGEELAGKAQPSKIKMRKKKGEYLRTLVIDVPASAATLIHYQKGLIMERMSRILGPEYIHDIDCISTGKANIRGEVIAQKKEEVILDAEKESYLADSIKDIEDEELKSRLNAFGKSVLKKPE